MLVYRVRFIRLGKWISSWLSALFQPWVTGPKALVGPDGDRTGRPGPSQQVDGLCNETGVPFL